MLTPVYNRASKLGVARMNGIRMGLCCVLGVLWLDMSACSKPPAGSTPAPTATAPAANGGNGAPDAAPSAPLDSGAQQSDATPPAPADAGPTVVADAAAPSPDAGPAPASAGAGGTAGLQPSAAGAVAPPMSKGCLARPVMGSAGVHFHHVHFNTTDPSADLAFYEKYFSAKAVEFCKDDAGAVTKATKTERGWFLYTKVPVAPDPRLNTYLEHIGWIHQDPTSELKRLVAAGAPRYPVGRAQCQTAFDGTAPCAAYWFYLQAPSGARVEVALGPGPATMGFGHLHMIGGVDYPFFEMVTGGAFKNKVIDNVNHTDAALAESTLAMEMVVDTKGKPIDHVAYSTLDLEAEKERIEKAGIKIEEDISFKPEYGFRSFFVKSAKGIWIEMVEDAPFVPAL